VRKSGGSTLQRPSRHPHTLRRPTSASMPAQSAAPPLPPGAKARALSPQELAAKVRDYEAFTNDVLKRKLQGINERRAKLEAERDELGELQQSVVTLQEVRFRVLCCAVLYCAVLCCAVAVVCCAACFLIVDFRD